MEPDGILVPFGILEVKQKQFNVVYGNSRETSGFIVDCLEHWWRYRKKRYPHIERLQIDLDNGPELESHRTQFIKRMVDWSDKIKLPVELVYYPPYHSKYNPVEHCWGVLEQHWNGALLTDWKPICQHVEQLYQDNPFLKCTYTEHVLYSHTDSLSLTLPQNRRRIRGKNWHDQRNTTVQYQYGG